MEEFQKIEDRYNEALESNDIKQISVLLADNWTLIEPSYGCISKEGFISAIRNGDLIHNKMKKKVINVSQYGDTAIVLTKGINKGQLNSISFDVENWVTNVYVKQNQEWLLFHSHESPINCKS